jgi:hypothetical protein
MHFVHIIEINDPRNPLIAALTREQLWRGLVRRAEQPMEFLPQLVSCSIVMRGDTTLARELDFGAFTVRDRVRLHPSHSIRFDTDPAPSMPTCRLVIAIEDCDNLAGQMAIDMHNAQRRLQLRFTYDVQRERTGDTATEQQYDRFAQSAYVQADIDSVKIIRTLAAAGLL